MHNQKEAVDKPFGSSLMARTHVAPPCPCSHNVLNADITLTLQK